MSSLFLANELLYLIVGHLDADSPVDRRALLSCALANNALRTITRPRVFRSIKIFYGTVKNKDVKTVFTDSGFATGARFLDIITINPLIAGFVKELAIGVVLRDVTSSTDICSNDKMFSLYQITPQLTKLQKFAVVSSSQTFQWKDTERTTRRFLHKIASQVQSLDVAPFQSFPVSAFKKAKKLRSLRVQNLGWNIAGNRHHTRPKVELDSLDIGYQCPYLKTSIIKCLSSPSTPLDLSCLRSLTFSCDISQEIIDILSLCSASLEELSLRSYYFYAKDPMPNLSFSSLHGLRLLKIQSDEPQMWFVATILKTLPHNRQNHQATSALTIVLGFTLPYRTVDSNYFPSLPWKDVTGSLFDMNMAGHLKRVKLVFTNSIAIQRVDAEAVNRVLDGNDALRELKRSGIITCEAY